jgi:hypothetical protein
MVSPYWLGVVKRFTLAIAASVSAAWPQSKPLTIKANTACIVVRLFLILALDAGQIMEWLKRFVMVGYPY